MSTVLWAQITIINMIDRNIQIEIIQHGSDKYNQTIALRDEVLRKPLKLATPDPKLSFTPESLAKEKNGNYIQTYPS
ncbi:MAG: hypothetical protein ACTSXQ_07580 [Alphaproteobacteria bacterium]